jgi:hypothetical protein
MPSDDSHALAAAQGISLLWTLLQNGHELLGGAPLAKRAIIVCPTSLVSARLPTCLPVALPTCLPCCSRTCWVPAAGDRPRGLRSHLPALLVPDRACPARPAQVSNWDSECGKWLKGRPLTTLPLCESSRDDVISSIAQFLHPSNPFKVRGRRRRRRRAGGACVSRPLAWCRPASLNA